jgi:hypothetical protein
MSDPSLQLSLDRTGNLQIASGTLRVHVQPKGGHYTASGWGLIQPETTLKFEGMGDGLIYFRANGPGQPWNVRITCVGEFLLPRMYFDEFDEGGQPQPQAFTVDWKSVSVTEFVMALLQINA